MGKRQSGVLDHVALHVRDMDGSLAFYTEVVGLRLIGRGMTPPGRERADLGPAGNAEAAWLVLFSADATAPEAPPNAAGVNHIAVAVESIQAMEGAAARARARGLCVRTRPEPWRVFVSDPDGNQVELVAARASYDFTKPGNAPRSQREQLGGLHILPRGIDKMRAHITGTLGEYTLSHLGIEPFGVTREQFEHAVRENDTDEGVLEWLYRHGRRPTDAEVEAFNHEQAAAGLNNPKQRESFLRERERLGFGHWTDITTFFDLNDLDDGREVPRRA